MLDQKIKGEIGYFNLESWWMNSFSDQERKTILELYSPPGSSSDSLIKGDIQWTSLSKLGLLSGLSSWFSKPEYYPIATKIIKKGEESIDTTTDILDIHFFYHNCIKVYYRNRDNYPEALDKTIYSCNKQIEISDLARNKFLKEWGRPLPAHDGYKQLAIIYEKMGKYDLALEVSQKALSQEWGGDWDKRIIKLKNKINKQ